MSTFTESNSAGEGTRERLLEVGERLFAEQGFAGASVREITAEAGCNVASVNYHFGGKEKLYEEVFRHHLGVMRRRRIGAIETAVGREKPTLEDVLRAFAEAFLEPVVDESGGRRIMQLLGRELMEPHLPEGMLAEEMIYPVRRALAPALQRVCPGLSETGALLCVHSLVAQLVHAVHLKGGQGHLVRPQVVLPVDFGEVLEHIVVFTAAGVRGSVAREEAGCQELTGAVDHEA